MAFTIRYFVFTDIDILHYKLWQIYNKISKKIYKNYKFTVNWKGAGGLETCSQGKWLKYVYYITMLNFQNFQNPLKSRVVAGKKLFLNLFVLHKKKYGKYRKIYLSTFFAVLFLSPSKLC